MLMWYPLGSLFSTSIIPLKKISNTLIDPLDSKRTSLSVSLIVPCVESLIVDE